MTLGFVQFGFVAIYLSESFIRGFMTAAGLQILISVLKYIFGIFVPAYNGPLASIYVSSKQLTPSLRPILLKYLRIRYLNTTA